MEHQFTFGPVPSRRLGRSMGINNLPDKICTCACLYCQAGQTKSLTYKTEAFFNPDDIFDAVEKKLAQLNKTNEPVDYLSIVPDGEPGLDKNLGRLISRLKMLGIPIAIISSSLALPLPGVADNFMAADYVSLKLDSALEASWKQVMRPHPEADHNAVMLSIIEFATQFKGQLVTETMLVHGLNDSEKHANAMVAFLKEANPQKAYLGIPVRPPMVPDLKPPLPSVLNAYMQVLEKNDINAEYLLGFKGNAFAFSGDARADILSITAVHPMHQAAMDTFLAKAGEKPTLVGKLINEGKLTQTNYEGQIFYMRKYDH